MSTEIPGARIRVRKISLYRMTLQLPHAYDSVQGVGAGMPKVGIWCMIFVMIFRKLSLQ